MIVSPFVTLALAGSLPNKALDLAPDEDFGFRPLPQRLTPSLGCSGDPHQVRPDSDATPVVWCGWCGFEIVTPDLRHVGCRS